MSLALSLTMTLALSLSRRDIAIHKSQSSNLEGLRAEVYSLQRELLQDRTKVKPAL